MTMDRTSINTNYSNDTDRHKNTSCHHVFFAHNILLLELKINERLNITALQLNDQIDQ